MPWNVLTILYLLGLNSDHAKTMIQFVVIPMVTLLFLMNILLLPNTIAIKHMIVIGFLYCHRSIMTTKLVIGILAAMWGVSLILTIMITIVAIVDKEWPLELSAVMQ